MRRLGWVLIIIALGVAGCSASKQGLVATGEPAKPEVKLERVEVVSVFPWADLPARTPLVLGFVFDINNPSNRSVMLDNMKFAFSFEVNPNYFVEINVPVSYDRIHFAPKTASQYRIVSVLDSAVVNGKLLVTQGSKLQELNLKSGDIIKNWYEKIGDFAFGIKVTEGMAVFSTDKGDVFVPFEGKFPTK